MLINSNYWLMFAPDPSDPAPPTYSSSGKTKTVAQPDPNPSRAVASGSQGGGDEWIKANPNPEKGLTWDEAVSREEVTEYQIQKAAWMVNRYAEFRKLVAR